MKRIAQRSLAWAMDGAMCSMMNALQWRLRAQTCTREDLENYLSACAPYAREDFYKMPPAASIRQNRVFVEWDTPRLSGFANNERAHVRLYPCEQGPSAPTVFILHALMSANDVGYKKLAAWFNARGWNAVFPHLPFHYSRRPDGFLNGELAITSNLIRNAETLRQGVVELRQLMTLLRSQGCREFGLVGTSYGGWTGALLSFLEADFRFLALIQPIVNVEHAIWENPSAGSMRRLLRARGIQPGGITRHLHLISPLHGLPLCGGQRAIITAGQYDRVSNAKDLVELQKRWQGSKLLHVRQGHFGHRALRETLKEIEHRL